MAIKFYNTLTKSTDDFKPLNPNRITIYTCGPTVYDHAHIGNLSSYIFADTLRRVISANGYQVKHAMNFTDVDDKTIRRSHEEYPELDPMDALKKLTKEYGDLFLRDMRTLGNDVDALSLIKAADDNTIEGMRQLIEHLVRTGFAYLADDGVYFSIDAYKKSGKKYGQLVELSNESESKERIQNDEYDKDVAHDFALWKIHKPGEPSWDFVINGNKLHGRPGWHIECSVMSRMLLGQPFDIHTGGIDNAFPHHENEIAQSTAGHDDPTYAQVFMHREHILVDGGKMSKSAQNFYTLTDLTQRGIDPMAFRLLTLQSHYRSQTNFSFDNVDAANNRLQHWRNIAALRHQTPQRPMKDEDNDDIDAVLPTAESILQALNNDLDTPQALKVIDDAISELENMPLEDVYQPGLYQLIKMIDNTLGLQLKASTPDITDQQKQILAERQQARAESNWEASDSLRKDLLRQGIAVRDTATGTIWEYA